MTTVIAVALILLYIIGLVICLTSGGCMFIAGLADEDREDVKEGGRLIILSPLWPLLAYQRYQQVMRQP